MMQRRLNWIIAISVTIIIIIILIIMTEGSRNKDPECTNKAKNVASNINYSIIDSSSIFDEKIQFDIRLAHEYKKSELTDFAYYIKNDLLNKEYKRIFICYYLPGMTVGQGAWATSHFNPNLEVWTSPYNDDTKIMLTRISNPVEEADKIFYSQKGKNNKIIGRWLENDNDYMMYIHQKNIKYYLTEFNSNQSYSIELVIQRINKITIFREKDKLGNINPKTGRPWTDEEYTDYYQIDSEGNLFIADKYGIIELYKKMD